MTTKQQKKSQSSALLILPSIALVAAIGMLAGCERDQRATDSTGSQPRSAQAAGGEQPHGQFKEFDGFTLRANVSPTEFLPDAMAQKYGIKAGADLALLNLVISKKRPDGQPASVSAEVSAQYESLIGHAEDIDMREIEADGHISYIGTLDTSSQRIFRFVIKAKPAGTDSPLKMNFEVQIPALASE